MSSHVEFDTMFRKGYDYTSETPLGSDICMKTDVETPSLFDLVLKFRFGKLNSNWIFPETENKYTRDALIAYDPDNSRCYVIDWDDALHRQYGQRLDIYDVTEDGKVFVKSLVLREI